MKRAKRVKGSKAGIPPWAEYVEKVLSGEIVTGQWVRLACERHMRDLKRQATEAFPYYFSADRAWCVINFFDHLKHSQDWFQGHSGDTFKLALWQSFILASVFGWLEWNAERDADPENDNRRFTEALAAVGRKNGKTTMLSGVGLYGLLADQEQGAQIWCFATKEEQAKILWEEAVRMRSKSPEISEHTKASKKAIFIEDTASKFGYLGSDSETQDGLNPHFGLCDELHAHPNRKMYDVVKSGQGARRQPLMFTITTAGFGQETFCRNLEEIGEKILQGILQDEHFFYYEASLNYDPTATGEEMKVKNDDWEDEKNWIKANPNLGISVNLKSLRAEAESVKNDPTELNNFLTRKMNLWVSQEKRWIPMDKWAQCGHVHIADNAMAARLKFIEANKGRKCYGGVDLSETTDLSALVLAFEPIVEQKDAQGNILVAGDPNYTVLPWFFTPRAHILDRAKKDRVPYDVWEREGFLTATEGNTVDLAFIEEKVMELTKLFAVKEVGYDPWSAKQFALNLVSRGAKMVEVRQGYQSLSEPCKELLKAIVNGKFTHFNNPVLTWNASNVAVRTDPNGNIAPDKDKARERIDGIAATVNAFNRIIGNAGQKKQTPKIYML